VAIIKIRNSKSGVASIKQGLIKEETGIVSYDVDTRLQARPNAKLNARLQARLNERQFLKTKKTKKTKKPAHMHTITGYKARRLHV